LLGSGNILKDWKFSVIWWNLTPTAWIFIPHYFLETPFSLWHPYPFYPSLFTFPLTMKSPLHNYDFRKLSFREISSDVVSALQYVNIWCSQQFDTLTWWTLRFNELQLLYFSMLLEDLIFTDKGVAPGIRSLFPGLETLWAWFRWILPFSSTYYFYKQGSLQCQGCPQTGKSSGARLSGYKFQVLCGSMS
jgi:hypothetical protein